MKRSRHMSPESPSWSPDAASGTVLADFLQRVSPQFVAAELDQLGLLDAADEAAAAMLGRVSALSASPRRARASLWMVALAMCATIVVVAEIRHFGPPDDDGGRFMQLAGPTPEW
jgi:hypothetical protein